MIRIVFIWILFHGFFVYSQEDKDEGLLSEVVVTAQINPQSIKKSVFNVRTISEKEIKLQAANNLADLLNQYLNIQIRPSGRDGKSTASMFGLDGQYFKILIDNIPIVSDNGFGNNVDLTQLNLDDIVRIEIIEGSMGVTHGANAVSGILNLITKKSSQKKWTAQASIQEETIGNEYSLYNQGRHIQSLKITHSLDNLYISLGSNRNDFTGFQGDLAGPDYNLNDGKRGFTWLPKLQWTTNAMLAYKKDKFNFFYKLDYMTEEISFFSKDVFSTYNPPFESEKFAEDHRYFTSRWLHHINSDGVFESGLTYTFSASYQKQQREDESFRSLIDSQMEQNLNRQKDQASEVFYSTANITNFLKAEVVDIQLGYETTFYQGFSRIVGENNFIKEISKDINNYDIFSAVEIMADSKFSIRTGFRYSFQSLFDDQYMASIGLRYLFGNDYELRSSFGKSFRTPNFEELFSEIIFSGHYFIGNSNLSPEQSNSYELSLKRTKIFADTSRITATVNTNFLLVDDKIEMALVETDPIAKSQFINVSDYKMLNFAATAQYQYKNFNANIGGSLVGISQRLNNGEAVSSDKYLYSFDFNTSTSLEIPKIRSSLSLSYKYNGKQRDFTATYDDAGAPTFKLADTEGFSWMDAALRTDFFKKSVETTIGVRNILDVTSIRQNSPNAGAAHPTEGSVMLGYGRSFFLKLVYKL